MKTITTDLRIDAVAEAIRNYEEGSTGWINTTERHQNTLRREAKRLLDAADAIDPIRIAVKGLSNVT